VKAEPAAVLTSVASLNVLTSPLSISTQPDQSKVTANMTAPTPT
jgi:hypothetical protein